MITENTLRIKLEATGSGEIKAVLGDVATQITAVDQAQQGAAASAQASAEAEKANATATQALGESAAEAEARIKAMVQASMARAEAERAAAEATQRTTTTQESATVGLGRLVEAQNRAMAGATRMVQAEQQQASAASRAAGIEAQRQELSKLVGQIDPTIAALEKLDQQQDKLNQFRQAGLLGVDDYKRFSAAIDDSRSRINAAGEAMSHFSLNNANARRELGYIVKDLATGQYGRMQQSLLTLANASGVMGLAFSATGAAIAGATAVVGLFAVGAAKGYLETERLRVSVIQTGGAVGATVTELNQMAVGVGDNTGKWAAARQAIELLAASGKVAGAGLSGLARQAVDMATVTGESIQQTVAKILQINDAPATTIAKLNEQYHFLTSAEYAQIAALEAEGRTREASRLANQLDATAMAARARDVQDNAGIIVRAGHEVASVWGAAWDAIKGIGRTQGLGDQVAIVQAKLESLTTGTMTPDGNYKPGPSADSPEVKKLQAELATLRAKQWQEALAANQTEMDSRGNQEAIAAQQRLSHYMTPVDTRDNALKKAAADRLAAMYGVVDPATKARIQAEYETQVKEINNTYAASVKKLAGPKSHSKEPAAYDTFMSQVDALDTKNITADNAALTQYEQGIRKLADEMANYMAKGGDATKAAEGFNRGQQALQKTLDANHAQEMNAERSYAAALDKKNASLQLSVDNQVASIGMGTKEYQQSQELAQAYRDQADALTQLAIERQKGVDGQAGGISQSQYEADVAALNRATSERVAIMNDGFRRTASAQADWTNGARSALQNFQSHALDVASTVRDGFSGMFTGMEDAAVAWATGSHVSLKSVEQDFERMLARMVVQALEAQAVSGLLGLLGGTQAVGADGFSAASGGMGAYSGLDSGSFSGGFSLAGHAEGGRISGPGTGTSDSILARLSNGENVITARATNHYGQRFMDDVNAMRLPRFADGGRVGGGGASDGMAGPAAGNVTVNIYGADNGAKVNQRQQGDGALVIDVILGAVARDVANGGKVGQAVNQVTGTRRPARSYAPAGA